ncbi:AzlC family ABC transporter permease, partial [Candidatus Pelagibacter sp.]|nr:AzlC family ABC transporter permease [Candidatus Pelagibacter sp.]
MSNKFKVLFKGVIDILPLLIPVVPFGIIFGAIGIELGFSALETFATSFIIFGGASQIVFIQLLSGGASNIIAVSSAFVVNSRHFLYGATLSEYLNKLPLGWKIILSYLLTDQAFAVSNPYFLKNKFNKIKHYHLLGSGLTLWVIWQISTLAGVLLGSFVPDKLGLSFTIPLTF